MSQNTSHGGLRLQNHRDDFIKRQETELDLVLGTTSCSVRIAFQPGDRIIDWASFPAFWEEFQNEHKQSDVSALGTQLFTYLQQLLGTDRVVLKISYPPRDDQDNMVTHHYKSCGRGNKRIRTT